MTLNRERGGGNEVNRLWAHDFPCESCTSLYVYMYVVELCIPTLKKNIVNFNKYLIEYCQLNTIYIKYKNIFIWYKKC